MTKANQTNKQKKKDLGSYYTPEIVVDFIFDILNVLKSKEDEEKKRWQSRKPNPHFPSVIDPACGEGIFLKKAIESGFTGHHPTYNTPYIWGVDIDNEAVNKWEEISILSLFDDDEEKMQDHFYHQNGLLKLPEKNLSYKKSEDKLEKFDAVVGNPPYGGTGISKNEIKDQLEKDLSNFEIWKYAFEKGQTLFNNSDMPDTLSQKIKDKLGKFPIEILFIERFLQLCKGGGWIGIVVPDGILANSSFEYVREFILERSKVLGIISLPRETFQHVGTNAKTSIIFLNKTKNKNNNSYPVFLSSVEKVDSCCLNKVVKSFKKFHLNKK